MELLEESERLMSSIIDEIRRKKRLYGYTNEEMAQRSGLPLSTVRKVLAGSTKSPGLKTVEALWQVFPEEKGLYSVPGHSAEALQESAAYAVPVPQLPQQPVYYPYTNAPEGRYPRQGSYTLEDYLALPDEQRVELIDGVFYDMSAPTIPHQLIGGAVYTRIADFLSKKKAPCVPLIAPTDVQLDKDNKTILQPDVMVVCNRDLFTTARLVGAPDFVIEVLSPSTRNKDILIKTRKYRNAGVKEYWMVDLRHEQVTKMFFSPPSEEEPEGDILTRVYPFEEPVPISIFQDKLSINFREIVDGYAYLFER